MWNKDAQNTLGTSCRNGTGRERGDVGLGVLRIRLPEGTELERTVIVDVENDGPETGFPTSRADSIGLIPISLII